MECIALETLRCGEADGCLYVSLGFLTPGSEELDALHILCALDDEDCGIYLERSDDDFATEDAEGVTVGSDAIDVALGPEAAAELGFEASVSFDVTAVRADYEGAMGVFERMSRVPSGQRIVLAY